MPDDLTTDVDWFSAPFKLLRRQEISRSNALVQARDLGPAIWQASYQTRMMYRDQAEEIEARMMGLKGTLGTFNGHTADRPRPSKYISGNMSRIKVGNIQGDRSGLRLTGLPGGMPLTSGDFISIKTEVGRELLKITIGGTSNQAGTSQVVGVTPHIRVSVREGDTVRMLNPSAEMRLDPGSLELRRQGLLFADVVFTATQVIR